MIFFAVRGRVDSCIVVLTYSVGYYLPGVGNQQTAVSTLTTFFKTRLAARTYRAANFENTGRCSGNDCFALMFWLVDRCHLYNSLGLGSLAFASSLLLVRVRLFLCDRIGVHSDRIFAHKKWNEIRCQFKFIDALPNKEARVKIDDVVHSCF